MGRNSPEELVVISPVSSTNANGTEIACRQDSDFIKRLVILKVLVVP